MRRELRQRVQRRYDFRCGYCGIRETDASSELTLDHFQPRACGGGDSPDNLVYCCHSCNEFKGDYWQTDTDISLLHPLRDNMILHYKEQNDGTIRALTEQGANHIAVLQLNRRALVALRLERRTIADLRFHYQSVDSRILEIEHIVRRIENRLDKLFGGPDA